MSWVGNGWRLVHSLSSFIFSANPAINGALTAIAVNTTNTAVATDATFFLAISIHTNDV